MEINDEQAQAAQRAIERDADELEHRIDRLGSDISDAHSQLERRKEEADIVEDAAGDPADAAPSEPLGDDPEGA
ncbi:MAG: hypothetical protein M3296_08975 [Actinomycetota bacterium]|nr:hypothetical protein [Actinomycetota bacterium]